MAELAAIHERKPLGLMVNILERVDLGDLISGIDDPHRRTCDFDILRNASENRVCELDFTDIESMAESRGGIQRETWTPTLLSASHAAHPKHNDNTKPGMVAGGANNL